MIQRLSLVVALAFFVSMANAQIGVANISKPPLGNATLALVTNLGQSSLPVCTANTTSCTVIPYTFIGNGSWQIESNWLGNLVPPLILPAGKIITIRPVEGGECILNVPQTIASGADLNVVPTKRLRVISTLTFLH